MDPDKFLAKCRATIAAVSYRGKTDRNWNGAHPVALVTVDDAGFPSARTVVPREISEDLSYFRLQTGPATEKLRELQSNPRVCLNYQDHRGRQGWLTVKGTARVEGRTDGEFNLHVDVTELRGYSYPEKLMEDKNGIQCPVSFVRKEGTWVIKSS